MKKQTIISIVIIALSVVLAVISFVLLPDVVVTQIGVSDSGQTTMPKLLAIALPFVLSIAGALFSLKANGDIRSRTRPLLVSVVGIAVYVLMLFINL